METSRIEVKAPTWDAASALNNKIVPFDVDLRVEAPAVDMTATHGQSLKHGHGSQLAVLLGRPFLRTLLNFFYVPFSRLDDRII